MGRKIMKNEKKAHLNIALFFKKVYAHLTYETRFYNAEKEKNEETENLMGESGAIC